MHTYSVRRVDSFRNAESGMNSRRLFAKFLYDKNNSRGGWTNVEKFLLTLLTSIYRLN